MDYQKLHFRLKSSSEIKFDRGLEFSCIELVIQMNNLLLYCGLVDAKIRASDKDLPVQKRFL